MTAMPEKAEGKEQGWLPIEEGLFEYPPDARRSCPYRKPVHFLWKNVLSQKKNLSDLLR